MRSKSLLSVKPLEMCRTTSRSSRCLAVNEYSPLVTVERLEAQLEAVFPSSWPFPWLLLVFANQAVAFVSCIITIKILESELSWQFS